MINSIHLSEAGWILFLLLNVLLAFLPIFWLSLTLQSKLGKVERCHLDIFSPAAIIAGAVFVGTTLRTIFLVFGDPAPAQIQRILGNHLPEDILLPGLAAINLGILAWALGYISFSLQRFNEKQGSFVISKNHYYKALGGMSLISFILIALYLDAIHFFSNLSSLGISAKRFVLIQHETTTLGHLRVGADILMGLVIIHTCYYYLIDRRPLNALILAFLVVAAIAVPFIASVRGEIIYLLFSILIIRHYAFRKIRPSYILVALILSFLILGFMETLRQQSLTTEHVEFKHDQILNTVIYTPHFIGVDKTSVIVSQVPSEIGYLKGRSYLSIFIAPIPRTLWQEKPVVRVGRYVGQRIYERSNRSGVPPGIIGEAYLNFGWIGIAAALFAVGVLCKFAYTTLIVNRHEKDVMRLGLYAIVIVSILDLMVTDFTGNIMRFLRYLLPYLLFMWLVRTRSSNNDLETAQHMTTS